MAAPDFEAMLVDSSRLVAALVVDRVGLDQNNMQELFRLSTGHGISKSYWKRNLAGNEK